MPISLRPGIHSVRLLILCLALTLSLGAEQTEDGRDVAALLKKAQAGDVLAQLDLANHVLNREDIPADDEQTEPVAVDWAQLERWLIAAAAKGNADAASYLGSIYFEGLGGVEQNYTKAFSAFTMAAKGGSVAAMLMLADFYTKGHGVPVDFAKAEEWLKRAQAKAGSDTGDAEIAAMRLQKLADARERINEIAALRQQAAAGDAAAAYKLYEYLGNRDDHLFYSSDDSMRYLRRAAELGEKYAQDELARQILSENPEEALVWRRKAAEQGVGSAQYDLGVDYGYGRGPARDRAEAARWLMLAAGQGLAVARDALAQFSFYPGPARSEAQALLAQPDGLAQLKAAAEGGSPEAQFVLADSGQLPSRAAAAAWLRKAAEQEHRAAMTRFAATLNNGDGVPRDVTQAIGWYARAARLGDTEAMARLAEALLNGHGVAADPALAKFWLQRVVALTPTGDPTRSWSEQTAAKIAATATAPEAALARLSEQAALSFGTAAVVAAVPAPVPAPVPVPAAAKAVVAAKQAAADRELVVRGDADAAFRLFRARIGEITNVILADFSAEQNGQPTSGKNYKLGYLDADMIKWGDMIPNNLHADGLVMLHDYLRDDRPDFAYRALLLRERIAKTDLRLQLPDDGIGTKSRAGFEKALAFLRGKLTSAQLAQTEKLTAEQFGGPWVDNVIGANFERGVCGYPQDQGLAVVHYRRAAEAGYAAGQVNLARCYELAVGVAKDPDQARAWYAKAALQGNATAQSRMKDYDTFEPMARIKTLSSEERAKLTEDDWIAAEALMLNGEQREQLESSDPTVPFQLGMNYRNGSNGFVQDYGRAYVYFSEAVEEGSASAHVEIGHLLFSGLGRPADKPGAFAQYLRAAELGDAIGQFSVGYCYLQGEGVARHPLAAHDWLAKAAAQGQPDAQTLLNKLRQDASLQLLLAQRNEQRALQLAQQGVGAARSNQPAPAYDPIKDNPILQQGALATKALQGVQAAAAELNAQQQSLKAQRDLINGKPPASTAKETTQPARALTAEKENLANIQQPDTGDAQKDSAAFHRANGKALTGLVAMHSGTSQPTPPRSQPAPTPDGLVSDLPPGTYAALLRIKQRQTGALTEGDAKELKQAILQGDGQIDDSERDLLAEMTQSQFRNIKVRSAGAKPDEPPVVLFPVVGNAKTVLRKLLVGEPDFEAEWKRDGVGYGSICSYYQESPEAAAEVVRFVAGKLGEEWVRSNAANKYKPLRDQIGRLYGFSNSLGKDTNTGRTILHRSMDQIDRNSGDQVPDFLYNWVLPGGAAK